MNAEADIEVINRANGAIERNHTDQLERLLHPDVVWAHNIGEGSPEEGIGSMGFVVPGSESEIAIPFVQRIEVRDGLATHVRLNVSGAGAAGTSGEGTERQV